MKHQKPPIRPFQPTEKLLQEMAEQVAQDKPATGSVEQETVAATEEPIHRHVVTEEFAQETPATTDEPLTNAGPFDPVWWAETFSLLEVMEVAAEDEERLGLLVHRAHSLGKMSERRWAEAAKLKENTSLLLGIEMLRQVKVSVGGGLTLLGAGQQVMVAQQGQRFVDLVRAQVSPSDYRPIFTASAD